jgi:hypothetical protein
MWPPGSVAMTDAPTRPTGDASAAADVCGDLVDHLGRTTQMPAGIARRVVDDVVAYFGETAEAVVRRRHRELQAAGCANAEIFDRIAAELAVRPVKAPELSARQLRRIVYG